MKRLVPALAQVLRSLRRQPHYFVFGSVILGVTIAVLLLVTAIADGVVFRPPSGRAMHEIAFVRSSSPSGGVTYPDYTDIRNRNGCFSGTFAFDRGTSGSLVFEGRLSTERFAAVSGNYFDVLGIAAAKGRLFSDADDIKGSEAVALISPELARRGNLDVGALIKLNQKDFVVVGILPSGFLGIDRSEKTDVWIPLQHITAYSPKWVLTNRGLEWVRVGGRLKPGLSLAAANGQIGSIGKVLREENPVENTGMDLFVDSFAAFRLSQGDTAKAALLVAGVAWLLFFLGFANFATLTLLRLFTRRKEIAIKLALGARSIDIARWILGELAVVLATAFGIGYGIALILLKLAGASPELRGIIEGATVALDTRITGVVAGGCLAAALAVWLFATYSATRTELVVAIKESAAAPRRQVTLLSLFAVQFAIAFFLGALGLAFYNDLRTTITRELPIRTHDTLLVRVNLRSLGIQDHAGTARFIRDAMTQLGTVPGIVAVGACNSTPLRKPGWTTLIIDGKDPSSEPDKNMADFFVVGPGYNEAAGVRLLQGRGITDTDLEQKAAVAVVSRSAVKRFWPTGDPIGKIFRPYPKSRDISIVGVCEDVPVGVDKSSRPQIFFPPGFMQVSSLTFYVVVPNSSKEWMHAVGEAFRPLWPFDSPVPMRWIEEQIAEAYSELRTTVYVILGITAFSVLITALGIYFFSAYTASQAVRDAAIRIAVGSPFASIVTGHLKRYRIAIVAGLVLGAALLVLMGSLSPQLNAYSSLLRTVDIGLAAAAMVAFSVVGLCLPLRQLRSLDIYRILGRDGD